MQESTKDSFEDNFPSIRVVNKTGQERLMGWSNGPLENLFFINTNIGIVSAISPKKDM